MAAIRRQSNRIGNPIQEYEPGRRIGNRRGRPPQRRVEVDLLRLAVVQTASVWKVVMANF